MKIRQIEEEDFFINLTKKIMEKIKFEVLFIDLTKNIPLECSVNLFSPYALCKGFCKVHLANNTEILIGVVTGGAGGPQ